MPLLGRILRQLPNFLHTDRIDLRTFPGIQLQPADQLLRKRAAHAFAENDRLGQNIDSGLERRQWIAVLANAAIAGANADQAIPVEEQLGTRKSREKVDAV